MGPFASGYRTMVERDRIPADLRKLTHHDYSCAWLWMINAHYVLKAGLFAAAVTGFAALSYTTLASAGDPDTAILHRYVAALWFAALVCGLAAAAVAIAASQWLNYLLTPAGLVEFGPRQKLRIWNLRQMALKRWHIDMVLGIPPVLLQVAVTLFLVALVGFLWPLSSGVATPTLILVCFVVIFQLATLLVPAVVVYTPCQSPQAQWARWIWINVLYMCALAIHTLAYGKREDNNGVVTVDPDSTSHGALRIPQKTRQLTARSSKLARRHLRQKAMRKSRKETLEKAILYLDKLRKRCDWVMNEKLYLDNPAHTEDIDSALFAATFAATVTKDDRLTLVYIQKCIDDLPVDLACTNAIALLDECDHARLDDAVRAEAGGDQDTWRHDSLSDHVTIMMADIIVDVTERLIDWKHPDHITQDEVKDELGQMINRLEELLHFLPHHEEADKIYRRLLHCLRDRKPVNEIETLARKYILSGIWKHVASFRFKGPCSCYLNHGVHF